MIDDTSPVQSDTPNHYHRLMATPIYDALTRAYKDHDGIRGINPHELIMSMAVYNQLRSEINYYDGINYRGNEHPVTPIGWTKVTIDTWASSDDILAMEYFEGRIKGTLITWERPTSTL